jgi:hypothetical protein
MFLLLTIFCPIAPPLDELFVGRAVPVVVLLVVPLLNAVVSDGLFVVEVVVTLLVPEVVVLLEEIC